MSEPLTKSGLSKNAKVGLLAVGIAGTLLTIWGYAFGGWIDTSFRWKAPVVSECRGVFSASQWRKAKLEGQEAWETARDNLVRTKAQVQGDDLIACGTLHGKTEDSVEKLLGRGERGEWDDGTEVQYWPLGYERRFAPVYDEFLLIELDENGQVAETRLDRW